MGSAKINNPMADGKEINNENSIDLFWILFVVSWSDCLIAFDKLGKRTIPSAIPKMASGNWLRRSA